MAIYNGKNLKVEIYGESHSEKIGLKVSGLPTFSFSEEFLQSFTNRRKASNSVFSTSRKEEDKPIFIGLQNGKTSDALTIEIANNNTIGSHYDNLYGKPRPSHADYTSFLKDGTLDFRGGGRFSGRLTAPLCVLGGLIKEYLQGYNIFVEGYISSIGEVQGLSYLDEEITLDTLLSLRSEGQLPSLTKKEEMLNEIENAKQDCDSVGGVIECIVYGLPGGIGDNLFEGLEGKISNLIYSVPAVKGVEFGSGFSLAKMRGSQANDGLCYENGKVKLLSNNAGGINGGISNGANITMRVAIRPTPSIQKEQQTIDLVKGENTKINIIGRHDTCIVPRAIPCIESAVMIALLDELIGVL